MKILVIFSYAFTLLVLRINGIEARKLKLSREDVAEIEKQIQLQNNYTVKTIHTRHGDLYDCVNYYKQPAFNHPLSKDLTFVPRIKRTLSHERARNQTFGVKSTNFGLNGRECPDGTVPIKRVTKKDLMRAKLAQANEDKLSDTRYAGCRSMDDDLDYGGASAAFAVYNPEVTNDQYSAAVMKLQIGPDSIETGWRVDPKLYGDNKTHLFIRTDACNTHCFNTLCPGFVVTNPSIPVDYILDKISKRGEVYQVDLIISYDDKYYNWILSITGNVEIGYWPAYLFQNPGPAQSADWFGEVFSPKDTPKTGMGSSAKVIGDTRQDAYFSFTKVQLYPGVNSVDPPAVECKAQTPNYEVKDDGNVGEGIEYLIFYGGPPSVGG